MRAHAVVRDRNAADGVGLAGGQPPRRCVGLISVLTRSLHHTLARALIDFGIPVQRAADGGLRQVQDLRQFLEIHRRPQFQFCAHFKALLETLSWPIGRINQYWASIQTYKEKSDGAPKRRSQSRPNSAQRLK